MTLNVKVSEKKLHEDPLEPIRIRRIFKKRYFLYLFINIREKMLLKKDWKKGKKTKRMES